VVRFPNFCVVGPQLVADEKISQSVSMDILSPPHKSEQETKTSIMFKNLQRRLIYCLYKVGSILYIFPYCIVGACFSSTSIIHTAIVSASTTR